MLSIPSNSREYVRVPVKGTESGALVDVTSSPVYMAFLASASAEPTSGDWKIGTWDPTPTISGYLAQCLVGPGGTVTLAEGTWNVWVRVVTSAEDVQEPAGQLRIV